MKKLTILFAVLLVLSSCTKEMPVPDSDAGYGNGYSCPGTSDPSDPGQDPNYDPGYNSGDDPGYDSGDDGSDDSGDDGSDDSGDDDGSRYKTRQHRSSQAPTTSSAAKTARSAFHPSGQISQ